MDFDELKKLIISESQMIRGHLMNQASGFRI